MFVKKSLILCGTDDKNLKAVLTLERSMDGYEGVLRLYNFKSEPNGIITLGITSGKDVKKAGLTRKSNMLYSFYCDSDLEDKFSCAVINFINGSPRPLLFGTTEDQNEKENRLASCINALSSQKSVEKVKEILDDNEIELEDDIISEVNEELDKHCTKPSCASCKYREAFFAEEKEEDQVINRFIDNIKDEIETIFSKYPEEEFLKKIIPSSKWARVEYDETGEYYVLGLIYDGEDIKYVCYGVPGIYEKTPPKELSGFPVFISLDESKPEGFGYWITYQDANSGEEIKVEVI